MNARRAGIRAAALAFAAAFALSIAATAVLLAVVSGAERGPNAAGAARRFALSGAGLMACASLEGLILLSVAVVAARFDGVGIADRLRLTAVAPAREAAARAGAASAGLVGLTFAYGAIAELSGFPTRAGSATLGALEAALRGAGAGTFALAVLTLGVLPALGEEALFRGFIQPALATSLGRWPAIAVVAAAFGLFHRDLVQGTGAFVAGLFLGWTVEHTRSLVPAIVAHAANNFAFIVLAALGLASGLPVTANVAALVVGTACCAGATWALRRA
ncbi:MAG: lysostaphin resistance A-like protein [Polyangiaceae bacterium]